MTSSFHVKGQGNIFRGGINPPSFVVIALYSQVYMVRPQKPSPTSQKIEKPGLNKVDRDGNYRHQTAELICFQGNGQ